MSWRRAPEKLADLGRVPAWVIGLLWAIVLLIGFTFLGTWLKAPMTEKQERVLEKLKDK